MRKKQAINELVVSGKNLAALRKLSENSIVFFQDIPKTAKKAQFESWRAVAVYEFCKENGIELELPKIVKKADPDDNATPIFQGEIVKKDGHAFGWTWLKFAGKPNPEMRETLKSNGFRYSAKNDKWYATSEVLEQITEALKPFYNL